MKMVHCYLVDEYIRASVVWGDKSVALGDVKPLASAFAATT